MEKYLWVLPLLGCGYLYQEVKELRAELETVRTDTEYDLTLAKQRSDEIDADMQQRFSVLEQGLKMNGVLISGKTRSLSKKVDQLREETTAQVDTLSDRIQKTDNKVEEVKANVTELRRHTSDLEVAFGMPGTIPVDRVIK